MILVSYITLIALIGAETIRRAVFSTQAVWGPEIALHAFVWLSWFSMAKHGRYGTNLAFSEVRKKLAPIYQRALEVMDCGLWLGIGVIIITTSYAVVENSVMMKQTIFGTPIPLMYALLAVPVGWGFAMLRILQRLWLVLFAWVDLQREQADGSSINL
ncbi:hypothetical protein PT7_2463 [Pusillimonas sp. T7-7]|nr:hypothetical protein PT7_2463 [Pusillimonas sp. T7-7]